MSTGYFDWNLEGVPTAARAHFNARALSVNPQSYAFATDLVSAYAVARDRGIKKAEKDMWNGVSFQSA